MKKKLMFTGGGGAGTESLWVNLSKKYDLFFADADVSRIDSIIPAEKRISLPYANDISFIEILKAKLIEKNIDVLIPGVDEELVVIAAQKDELSAKVLLPDGAFIVAMLDKYQSMQEIMKQKLSCPRTELVEKSQEIGYPQIVKPRSGRGSRGVSILDSHEEVLAYLTLNKVEKRSVVAQELAVGVEYTVLIAADDNAILKAIIPVKIIEKNGITIRAVTDLNTAVIAYCHKFQNRFKATGVYNLQCILTDKGAVTPFEINPRVSTTFCLGIAAGFDPFDDTSCGDIFYPNTQLSLSRNWRNYIEKSHDYAH